MDLLREYVRNIAVYVIFMGLAGVIVPEGKLKSFVDLTMGVILVLILAAPISGLLGMDFMGAFSDVGLQFERRVVAGEFHRDDEAQNQLVLAAFHDSLRDQVRRLLENDAEFAFVDARFDIGRGEEDFGEILAVSVIVAERAVEESARGIIWIEPVSIWVGAAAATDDEGRGAGELRIKNAISDFYKVPSSNIHVIVQKIAR